MEFGLDWTFGNKHLIRDQQNIKDEETGKVLDISGSDFRAGTEVILWTKSGGENQAWYLKQDLPASNGKSFKLCIFNLDRSSLNTTMQRY